MVNSFLLKRKNNLFIHIQLI